MNCGRGTTASIDKTAQTMFRNFYQFIDDALYVGGLVFAGSIAFLLVSILGLGLAQFLVSLAEVK